MRKILTVIGARPQFIKCAPVSKQLRKNFEEVIVHTGQHYDENMSKLFFDELDIFKPKFNLEVGSETQTSQVARMMEKIETIILSERPDFVLVYGDTNSTLAGALTAVKMNIKTVHIEAGLRSYNRTMPEEINRIVTDHISDILFVPTKIAVENLICEGIKDNVFNVGDVMNDAVIQNSEKAEMNSKILHHLGLEPKKYYFVTLHRPYNVDTEETLQEIISAFNSFSEKIIFPLHPRTKSKIREFNISINSNVLLIEPVGYLDSLVLQKNSKKVITDSGGIQKEAFILDIPCVTLRPETEWIETVNIGANILVKTRGHNEIIYAINSEQSWDKIPLFGDGNASELIANHLLTLS